MPTEGIPVTILAIVWAIRELVPFLVRLIREHRSDRPPAPPMRAELPTPEYGRSADGSGAYAALAAADAARGLATRQELATASAELRSLHADLASRIALMTRDLAKLEDVQEELTKRIEHLSRDVGKLEGIVHTMGKR